jgi:hypothetical protein
MKSFCSFLITVVFMASTVAPWPHIGGRKFWRPIEDEVNRWGHAAQVNIDNLPDAVMKLKPFFIGAATVACKATCGACLTVDPTKAGCIACKECLAGLAKTGL